MSDREREPTNGADDYLWDRSGTPDPEVARLERVLGAWAHGRRATARGAPVTRARPRRGVWQAAAAACAIGAMALWLVGERTPGAGVEWRVERSHGTGAENARVGAWIETAREERVRLSLPDLGRVDLEPGSRFRIAESDRNRHVVELAHGKLHALIVAPPRLFIVETPAARAVDLGCAYTIEVDPAGNGFLHVTAGHVELEGGARGPHAYVPRGAICAIDAGRGPGVPRFEDAPPAMATALADLGAALGAARPRDTLTLWHLLPRVANDERALVLARIAELADVPAAIDRAAVLALDPGAVAGLRDALQHLWNY